MSTKKRIYAIAILAALLVTPVARAFQDPNPLSQVQNLLAAPEEISFVTEVAGSSLNCRKPRPEEAQALSERDGVERHVITPASHPGAAVALAWPRLSLPESAGRIDVPETNVVLPLPFDLTAHGAAGGSVTQVDIVHNSGQVRFGDRVASAVAYVRQFSFGLTLYQVISTEADEWHVFWLYCQGPSLVAIYHEDTATGDLSFSVASGSCSDTFGATDTVVHLAPTAMQFPKRLTRYKVDGPGLHVSGGAPGSIVIGGRTMTLLPFADVDCSKACGAPGWFELHVLIWDPDSNQSSFAILYLREDAPNSVLLAYGLTLPTAQPLPQVVFADTQWSVPQEAGSPNPRQIGSGSFVDTTDCVDPIRVDQTWNFVTHVHLDANSFVSRLQFTGFVRVTFTDLANGQTRTVDSSGPGTVDVASGTFTIRGNNALVFDQTGTLTDSSGRLVYDSQGNLISVTGHQRPVCEMLGTQPLH